MTSRHGGLRTASTLAFSFIGLAALVGLVLFLIVMIIASEAGSV